MMNADHFATWPNVPITALKGKTPLQAVKTLYGRERVESLIADFERTQEHERGQAPHYDFNLLREAVRLPLHDPPKPRGTMAPTDDAH